MTRRQFLRAFSAAGACAFAVPLLAGCAGIGLPSARPARVPRIGYLDNSPRPASLADFPFTQGLRQLGYVEDKTIVVDYRFTNDGDEALAALARELVQAKVDIVVTGGLATVPAAKQATAAMPLVIAHGGDPVVEGWAASYAHPGGNVTGNNSTSASLAGKRLELLKQAAPSLSMIGVLFPPSSTGKLNFEATQAAAPALGLQIVSIELPGGVLSPSDFERAFRAAAAAHVDGLTLTSGAQLNYVPELMPLVVASRLPSIATSREWPHGGGLMAYGANRDELVRHAATYVDRILKGAKPGDLPIEQPAKYDFVVNLKAAQALGLIIPPAVLAQATEVIQ